MRLRIFSTSIHEAAHVELSVCLKHGGGNLPTRSGSGADRDVLQALSYSQTLTLNVATHIIHWRMLATVFIAVICTDCTQRCTSIETFTLDVCFADTVFIHGAVDEGGATHLATMRNPVSYHGCKFMSQAERGASHASNDLAHESAVIESASGTPVRLEDCDFQGTPHDRLLLNWSPQEQPDVFFSDITRAVANTNSASTNTLALSLANDKKFLTPDDPIFEQLQKVLFLFSVYLRNHACVRYHAYLNAPTSGCKL